MHGQSEVTAEKAIGLLAIVQLVVMRSRVGVLVPFKGLLFPEQPEEGQDLVVEVGFGEGRPAHVVIVLGGEHQQGGARRPQGGEMSVIDAQVGRVVLHVPHIGVPLDSREEREIPRDRGGSGNPFIQSAQDPGLPGSPGQARDPQAIPVDMRVTFQVVQALAHGQIKKASGAHARQIHVAAEPVVVPGQVQFPTVEPFQTQGQHASQCVVDAAYLLVTARVANGRVAVHIDDGRDLPGQVLGLIEEGRRLETGEDLVAKSAQPVAPPRGDDSQIFEFGLRFHPAGRPTVEDHVFQDPFSQFPSFSLPFPGVSRSGEGRHAFHQVLAQLELDGLGRLNRQFEDRAHLLGGLRKGKRRMKEKDKE